jgi:Na+-driven multidrug efflux pump
VSTQPCSALLLPAWRSVNTRVGNELGAGNAGAARLAVYTCVACVCAVQTVLAVGTHLGDRWVVRLLSNNEQVQRLTLEVFPLLLPTFVCEWLGGRRALQCLPVSVATRHTPHCC